MALARFPRFLRQLPQPFRLRAGTFRFYVQVLWCGLVVRHDASSIA
jgi:hypothetical protein